MVTVSKTIKTQMCKRCKKRFIINIMSLQYHETCTQVITAWSDDTANKKNRRGKKWRTIKILPQNFTK
jgi:hypothetical protein